jgi:hypothetical protein
VLHRAIVSVGWDNLRAPEVHSGPLGASAPQGFPEKHGTRSGPAQPKCGAYALDPVLIKKVRRNFPASCWCFSGTVKWRRREARTPNSVSGARLRSGQIRAWMSSIVSHVRIPKARSSLAAHERSVKPGIRAENVAPSRQGQAGVRTADDPGQCDGEREPVRGIADMAAPPSLITPLPRGAAE